MKENREFTHRLYSELKRAENADKIKELALDKKLKLDQIREIWREIDDINVKVETLSSE